MTNKTEVESELPEWIRKTSADEMVILVRQLLEADGHPTTKRGRAYLRTAYHIRIQSFDESTTEIAQSGMESEEAAARRLVEVAKQSNVFAGYSRAGYSVMERIVKVLELLAKREKVCPAWPFC